MKTKLLLVVVFFLLSCVPAFGLEHKQPSPWRITVVGDPDEVGYTSMQRLQDEWAKIGVVLFPQFAHVRWCDRDDASERWRYSELPIDNKRVWIIVQPPVDGSRGDQSDIVACLRFLGSPSAVEDRILRAIRGYVLLGQKAGAIEGMYWEWNNETVREPDIPPPLKAAPAAKKNVDVVESNAKHAECRIRRAERSVYISQWLVLISACCVAFFVGVRLADFNKDSEK